MSSCILTVLFLFQHYSITMMVFLLFSPKFHYSCGNSKWSASLSFIFLLLCFRLLLFCTLLCLPSLDIHYVKLWKYKHNSTVFLASLFLNFLHVLFFYNASILLCKVLRAASNHRHLPTARYIVEVAWLSKQVNPLCEAIAPPPVLARPSETKLMAELARLLTFCNTDPAASIPG